MGRFCKIGKIGKIKYLEINILKANDQAKYGLDVIINRMNSLFLDSNKSNVKTH